MAKSTPLSLERPVPTGFAYGAGVLAPKALLRFVAEDLEISEPQAHMLVALLDFPAMDYAVSESLGIYSRSKMGTRVLDPLKRKGLLIYHSLPPRKGKSGAPRMAWGFARGGREAVEKIYRKAQLKCEVRVIETEALVSTLCVKKIYAFVDWLTSASGLDKASVCTKGCHHCCYLDVDVSLLEAAYIARNTPYTQVMRESRIRKGYHQGRQYCGFLDRGTGTCSIYEFRPLACRSFFAFDDPELCDKDEGAAEHAIFNVKALTSSPT